eukprot:CAMPEP_0115880314 /NCGR_PEP_ID=MMETSP0287-20121206/27805_1 /TAXON_ID=412157 /ORGANISM="Chrysochromulina rotalis, Strain UIO044" /LENGTH=30 /DNA_ID= /DNA_START= /DNA_END= /DNA_ORIENTATION=
MGAANRCCIVSSKLGERRDGDGDRDEGDFA